MSASMPRAEEKTWCIYHISIFSFSNCASTKSWPRDRCVKWRVLKLNSNELISQWNLRVKTLTSVKKSTGLVERMAEVSLCSLGVCFDYKKYIQREGWQKIIIIIIKRIRPSQEWGAIKRTGNLGESLKILLIKRAPASHEPSVLFYRHAQCAKRTGQKWLKLPSPTLNPEGDSRVSSSDHREVFNECRNTK